MLALNLNLEIKDKYESNRASGESQGTVNKL